MYNLQGSDKTQFHEYKSHSVCLQNETSSAYPLAVCVLFSPFKTSLIEFIVSQTFQCFDHRLRADNKDNDSTRQADKLSSVQSTHPVLVN
jgi:hypothetical protein